MNVKHLVKNSSKFYDEIEEELTYTDRKGNPLIDHIKDTHGNVCESKESLPNEVWEISFVSEDQKGKSKPEYFFQKSNLGRIRKINRMPIYWAAQRVIDRYRKTGKREINTEEFYYQCRKYGEKSNKLDENYTILSQTYSFPSIESTISLNDSVKKIMIECKKTDLENLNKVENRGRYKSKTPVSLEIVEKFPLLKQFCFKLRACGAEDSLDEDVLRTIKSIIGSADCATDYDIAIHFGYDKYYNLKASNGSCRKIISNNKKLKEIAIKFGLKPLKVSNL
jgi:hypothetical protein